MSTHWVKVAASARAAVAALAGSALLWGAGAWGASPPVSYTPVPAVAASATTAPALTPSTAGKASTAGPASADPVSYTEGHLRVAGLVDVEVVETIAPGPNGVIRPSTQNGAARVEIPGAQAAVFAMHAGPAGAPGTALTLAGGQPAVGAGDLVVLPDGGVAVTTDAWVSAKVSTGDALASALVDPGVAVLVTCRVEASPVSTSNVVIVARRT